MILLRLTSITIIPTASIMDFADILFATLAAMGEAIALPRISPPMASQ